MGKPEVNKDTLKMAHPEQDRTSDRERGNKTDILRDFRVSFFAMSRLVSFPWTVSKTESWSRVYHVTIQLIERALRQSPFKYVSIRSFWAEKCLNMSEIMSNICFIRHL